MFHLSLWYLLCQPLCLFCLTVLYDFSNITHGLLWFCCCTLCGSLELWISKNENRLEMRTCTDCGHILSDKLSYDVWCKLHIVSYFIFLSPWQLLNYMKFFFFLLQFHWCISATEAARIWREVCGHWRGIG